MEQQYLNNFFSAYKRGFALKYKDIKEAPERKDHYFKVKDDLPRVQVTSLDILPHRVELLQCIHDGGISNLHPILDNICTFNAPDKSFDVVTMLEVVEHIPDTETVVKNAIRLARNYVIVSVPSKPDDNPEHIHLFSNEDLKSLILNNGCSKVKFMSVTNHTVMVAYLN